MIYIQLKKEKFLNRSKILSNKTIVIIYVVNLIYQLNNDRNIFFH